MQAVLVNNGTAGTNELLAGAVRSNRGAVLVGERMYGKGVTQKVVTLSDGTIYLLSTVSYKTADREVVNKVGLKPSVACKPEIVVRETFAGGAVGAVDLMDDPCIAVALKSLASKPAI